jgi:hypothetical protein
MTNSRIASIVLGLAMLIFGAASCDIFDPYDPGDPGHGGGGGGKDTIIIDDPRDTSGNHDDDDQPMFIRAQGTVVWVELEGGFWGIEATNGHEYEPINLPEPFQVNGLKVAFSGQLLDWGSAHMWGKVLEVHEISKI